MGIFTGISAIIFNLMLIYAEKFLLINTAGLIQPLPHGERENFLNFEVGNPLIRFLLPAFGGLIVGWLIYRFAPETAGHGTDAVIDSYHKKRGLIRPIVPIIKTIASAITLGSGGSGGREGPVAQTGGGIGSVIAKMFKMAERDRRILVLSGVGGGIGSIFRAPLGGALFSTEVLYRQADFEGEAVMPSIISAITAYSIFGFFATWRPIFLTPAYKFNVQELGFFAVLGLLVVPFSYLYVKTFYWVKEKFDTMKLNPIFKPMIGGLLTGLILLFMPHVAGTSYGWIQMAMLGKISILLMFSIAIFKIIATSFTIASGGSGGVFAPSLVIGGMVGGVTGVLLNHFLPGVVHDPSPYVMVGMGSFFAAAAKVPLATIVMVAEMTGNYDLLVPITLASSIAFLVSGRWSIYESQVNTKMESPAHRGDFVIDVLKKLKVKDIKELPQEIPYVMEDTNLISILQVAAASTFSIIPVIDKSNRLKGIIDMSDLRSTIYQGDVSELGEIIIAKDIEKTTLPSIKPEETLQKALDLFTNWGADEIIVVNKEEECLGILTRGELLKGYNRAILQKIK